LNTLKEISLFSAFRPDNGDLLRLFQLAIVKEVSRDEAATLFTSKNHFNVIYKKLKDNLLDGLVLSSFKGLSKIQTKHFKIRKRSVESIMLLYSEKKNTGAKLAEETLIAAMKYDLVDIVLSMSRELENHYAVVDSNNKKWKKFHIITTQYLNYFSHECSAQSLFSELAICIRSKKNPKYLLLRIEALEPLLLENYQFKFRLYYYSILNLYARYNNDQPTIIKTCQDAIAFFSKESSILTKTSQWNFKFQMIPIFLAQKKYAKAEILIRECIQYPKKGSYNWHLTLLYQTILGFYSNKPQIVVKTWKLATNTSKKFQSEVINNRWLIIRAYLCFYAKVNRINYIGSFRLYRFLNGIQASTKGKINLYILELLHLLVDGKKIQFMKRVEYVETYIRLNPQLTKRARYFLRMLRAVELGDYHIIRVTAHAKKNYQNLLKTEASLNANVLDAEPVKYEILWDLILDFLQKK